MTWISVKERMPERPNCYAECADVLVWDADDEATQVAAWDGFDWFCDCYGHIERCKRITHWMPLPDPPETGGDR